MANEITELVHIIGEEPQLNSRISKAIEWISSKPEGMSLLKEAHVLHGKPLEILCDSKIATLVYGSNGKHIIHANPLISDHYVFRSLNGEPIPCSVERFISHELKHAAQEGMLQQQAVAGHRMLEITFESIGNIIPFDQYFHRLDAAQNDLGRLRKTLEEMYDIHIVPNRKQLMNDIIQKAGYDPIYQKYIKDYEVPAIEFENLMMKYKNEPARSTDYLEAAIYDELLKNETVKKLERESFIDSFLSSFEASVEQKTMNTKHPTIK